jgi:hypothetical protein
MACIRSSEMMMSLADATAPATAPVRNFRARHDAAICNELF